MGLEGYAQRSPQYLSGGEKKRVTIADILAMEPDVILLDEPTASLDPENVTRLEEILDRLTQAGIALLVSTHDVDFAFGWADEAVLFHNGKVLRQGAPEEVFAAEEDLEKTNLTKPAALRLFDNLVKNGVLPEGLAIPRDLDALEKYIREWKGKTV